MFASNPKNAIVTIQFLASITLIAVRECYVMSSESLRWSLAANGTNYLCFLVLSQSTGFMGLLRIIISWRGNLFSSWRLLAVFRFVVLYVALVVAQFIWILNIDSRTAYMPLGSDQQRFQSKRLGIGDFNLTLGTPWPFSQVDSWEYLMDRSRVVTIAPQTCTPNPDGSCKAYVIFANPINYTIPVTCPSTNQEICAVNGIFYDIPSYVVEFQPPPDAWRASNSRYTHCINYTSSIGVELLMCMGAESTSSSAVNFLWDICADQYNATKNSCQPGSQNSTTTATMSIQKANVTMVVNLMNQTIVDVASMSEPVPYSVNVSALFAAYTAPLTYLPVNLSVLWDVDRVNFALLPNQSIVMNGTSTLNSSELAEIWVDSTFYSLKKYLKPQAYRQRVYGFLAYALAANSRKFVADDVPRFWQAAEENTILSVSLISIGVFTGMSAGVLVTSLVMLFKFGKNVIPNVSLYPDITFGAKVGVEMMMTLRGLSNADSGSVIKQLADKMIQVGKEVCGGMLRVVVSSTTCPDRLRTSEEYV
jgi:hypothetical protein